jgi:uncharacterized protein
LKPRQLGLLVMGLALGFALSRIGFSSWDEVHRMFTFADLRLLLTFAAGVVLLSLAFLVVKKTSKPDWPARPLVRGTILGGVIFGVGWALSGACPGVALVQLGEGKLFGALALAGMLLGNFVYARFFERRLVR